MLWAIYLAYYKVPFDKIAAATFATVAVFFNLVPIAVEPVKLLVGVAHAFCMVNEADPVSSPTGTPLSTEPVEGIATVPVNWAVSPNKVPCRTFEMEGKFPG